jgi:hypothetical protein
VPKNNAYVAKFPKPGHDVETQCEIGSEAAHLAALSLKTFCSGESVYTHMCIGEQTTLRSAQPAKGLVHLDRKMLAAISQQQPLSIYLSSLQDGRDGG